MQLNLRLANISYLNTLPLKLGLEAQGVTISFSSHPTAVNEALLSGEVDLGPVSSIFYAQHREKFFVLRDLCISARGKVRSVILISRRPLEELEGRKVSLTCNSATSRQLLKIIFRMNGVKPIYIEGEEEKLFDGSSEAALLIGDKALTYFSQFSKEGSFFLYDIAEEWFKLTGFPAVFALWVVRREYAIFRPEEVQKAHSLLVSAVKTGLSFLSRVVEEAQRLSGVDWGLLEEYYRGLDFFLSEEAIAGLIDFYQRSLPDDCKNIKLLNLSNLSYLGQGRA